MNSLTLWSQVMPKWCHGIWSVLLHLTHWGRVTHICVFNLTIIGSDNGLSPSRRQAIIWTNDGILLIEPLGTKFSEILIAIQTFSFKKIYLKISSAKWRPSCLGLNVLIMCCLTAPNPYQNWSWLVISEVLSHGPEDNVTVSVQDINSLNERVKHSEAQPNLLETSELKPSTCGDRINSVQPREYHGCWCPGSLRRQDISTHDIDNVDTCTFLSYSRKNFSYLCNVNVEEWHKM